MRLLRTNLHIINTFIFHTSPYYGRKQLWSEIAEQLPALLCTIDKKENLFLHHPFLRLACCTRSPLFGEGIFPWHCLHLLNWRNLIHSGDQKMMAGVLAPSAQRPFWRVERGQRKRLDRERIVNNFVDTGARPRPPFIEVGADGDARISSLVNIEPIFFRLAHGWRCNTNKFLASVTLSCNEAHCAKHHSSLSLTMSPLIHSSPQRYINLTYSLPIRTTSTSIEWMGRAAKIK